MKRNGLIILLLLWSCGPDRAGTLEWWQGGDVPRYSGDRFVIGIGAGDSCAEAEDAARGRVAAFFRASVVSVERETDSVTTRRGPEEETEEREFRFDRFVRVRAEAELEGVKIVARHVDDRGGCQAVAVLDRVVALRREQGRVRKIQAELSGHRADLQAADGPRARAGASLAVLETAARLRRVQVRSDLLSGRTSRPPDVTAARTTWRRLARERFAVAVSTGDRDLDALVREELAAVGLVPAQGGEAGLRVVTISRTDEERRRGPDTCLLLRISLAVRTTGEPARDVATAGGGERICHPDRAMARRLALRELKNAVVIPLVNGIIDYVSEGRLSAPGGRSR